MSYRTICMGLALGGALWLSAVAGSGCASSSRTLIVYSDQHGPPPHAPANGYRCKHRHGHDDVELVYDSGLQVYVVVGRADHYFLDGYYFRVTTGGWYSCKAVSGPWVRCNSERVPPGLAKRYASANGQGHDQGNHKSKGKGHDKH
ncbi:MAG TPA: hypothetical protein VNM87_14035 [Candidatus Udaeobacter sp.]|nr:hypothetical protein [Candidatus Udaeobacter sp.]